MIPARHKILVGDVREQLSTLEAQTFHCCVTSPPYWALRDYGVDGQLGLEPTAEAYIQNMITVFDCVKRVLRDDGVCWVNLGDTYSNSGKSGGHSGNKNYRSNVGAMPRTPRGNGLDGGQQLLMPHRFAMAMQQAGWILRSTIVWSKRSPMPESLRGTRWRRDESGEFKITRGSWRATTSHEYVFMFVKAMKYFSDSDASAEQATGSHHRSYNTKTEKISDGGEFVKQNERFRKGTAGIVETRNMRSVWSLSTEPFKGAHFATFPSELVRRCLSASVSRAGCCSACGSQLAPIVSSHRVATRPGLNSKVGKKEMSIESGSYAQRPHNPNMTGNRDPQRHTTKNVIEGYKPTCDCTGLTLPPRVLDPFTGSGTTGQVAVWSGCEFIGCEINPEYSAMAEKRILTPWKPKAEKKPRKRRRICKIQMELFE